MKAVNILSIKRLFDSGQIDGQTVKQSNGQTVKEIIIYEGELK
jgi:hypothetical protein